jgi:hypothetical protein
VTNLQISLSRAILHCVPVVFVLLSFASAAWGADDTKPENIVAKSLDSVGTAQARAAIQSRAVEGSLRFNNLLDAAKNATGYWGYFSEQQKTNFVMTFGEAEWRGERFAFDGNKTFFASFTSAHVLSSIGRFMFTYDFIVKEGLLGGELSTHWALEDLDRTRAKIRYAGLKKIDGRSLQMIEYFPKGNEMDIKIYFDPDTHHHVMTVYFLTWNPGIGRGGPRHSAGQLPARYTIEERFSDFRTDNGITLPWHYELRYTQEPQNGATRNYDWDMTAEKVGNNVSLDPQNFEMK